MKRTYSSPLSLPTDVVFEQALLVATATLFLEVDPTVNKNAEAHSDEPGHEMYFEF